MNSDVCAMSSEIKKWAQLFSRNPLFVLKKIVKTSLSVIIYDAGIRDHVCATSDVLSFLCL